MKFRRDEKLVLLGFVAGITIGTAFFLPILQYIQIIFSLDFLKEEFEGVATIIASIIAVTGIGWQLGISRVRDRQNFQYKILHEHRMAFNAMRNALVNRYNILAKTIIQRKGLDHDAWDKAFDEVNISISDHTLGKLLSFSSKIGVACNTYIGQQNDLYDKICRNDYSEQKPDEIKKRLANEYDELAPYLEKIAIAVTDNELPKFPSTTSKFLKVFSYYIGRPKAFIDTEYKRIVSDR